MNFYKLSKQYKLWLIVLVGLIFLSGILLGRRVLAPQDGQVGKAGLYKVVEIIDGDTIKLESGVKVRLIGVDAPEKGECFYEQARQGLKALLESQTVRLEKDVSDKDKYGRWLRYVFVSLENREDVLVNQWLVWQGYARAVNISPDNRLFELLSVAEEEAKKEKRGLWGECK